MSTQEKYVHSLKRIKDAEEKTQTEIESYKKKIVEDIISFQIDAETAVESAKTQGEKSVEKNIE